jgi:hypothetical protein
MAGDKVYHPYFKIQLKAYCVLSTSLLRTLTSIQQLWGHEYLWDYLVKPSSIIILLLLARVGLLWRFNTNEH